MLSITRQAALRGTRSLLHTSRAYATSKAPPLREQLTHSDGRSETGVLKRGAKRDPELYILYVLTAGMLGVSGWVFSTFNINGDGPYAVAKIANSEPWKDDTHSGQYKFFPKGDTSKESQPAPSALHTTIVPNVTLPRELHEQFNKYGKPEWDF